MTHLQFNIKKIKVCFILFYKILTHMVRFYESCVFYHQIKISIDFLYNQKLNPKSFIYSAIRHYQLN